MTDEEIEKIVNQSLGLTSDSESVVATKTNDTYLQSKNEESNSNEDIRSLSALLDKELGFDKYEHKTPRQPVSEVQTSESVDDKIQDLQNKLRELMALKNQKEQNQSRKIDVKTDNGNTNVVVNMPQNKDTQTHFNLVCETCGSTDIRMVNNSLGVCGHCGANVVIKKPTENSSVINIYNNSTKSDSDSDDDIIDIEPTYYLLKPKYSQEEFQRKMMIFLSSLIETPTDILSREFEVKTEYVTFMFSEYHVTGSYSASVGYDRQEQYEDYEDKWNYELKRNVRQRVIKERTVTDWRPYNRDVSENQKSFVKIPENNFSDEDDEVTFGNLLDYYPIKEEDYEELKDSGLNIDLKEPSKNDESRNKCNVKDIIVNNTPGERKKDLNYKFSFKLVNQYFIVVPKYVLNFKYRGNDYQQSAYAAFKFAPIGSYDFYKTTFQRNSIYLSNKEKRYPKYDFDTNIKKLCIKHGYFSILLSLLSIILAVSVPFLNITYYTIPSEWFVFGGVASMLVSIIGFIVYKKMCERTKKNFYRKTLIEKKSHLETYLKKSNMEPLSRDEINLFMDKEGK